MTDLNKRDRFQYQMPSDKEKEQSIRFIVEMGMPQPKRLSDGLFSLWNAIGLRGLFFGVEDCIFLSFLLAGIFSSYFISASLIDQSFLYVMLFFTSPFLYILLHLLTTWKEIMNGTYQWKMVCRFSLQQIATLRMMVFGGISVVITVLISTGIWLLLQKEVSLIRMMSISFSALFTFASAQLIVEWKTHSARAYFFIPAAWVSMGGTFLFMGEPAQHLIMKVPVLAFFLVAAAAAVLYVAVLRCYYFERQKEVINYAFR